MSDNPIAQRVANRYAVEGVNWTQAQNNVRSIRKEMTKLDKAVSSQNPAATLHACSSLVAMAARLAGVAAQDSNLGKSGRGLSDKIYSAAKNAPTE